MRLPWHDGLVQAFPIPENDHVHRSGKIVDVEKAMNEMIISPPSSPPIPATSTNISPFPFSSLPAEVRNRIYRLVLFSSPSQPRRACPHPLPTALFLTSSHVHREASYVFYTTHTFPLFPLQEFLPNPTVAELGPMYRPVITRLEVTLGPHWTGPPPSWKVTKRLSQLLKSLSSVRHLRIFIHIDPSNPIFSRFRLPHGFYTDFAGDLVADVLRAMPQLDGVRMDGRPSVDVDGPLVRRLRRVIGDAGRPITWSREGGWEPPTLPSTPVP
jgi:hypothetical protein